MGTEGVIRELAPALRTGSQTEAFRIAFQALGDPRGLESRKNTRFRETTHETFRESPCIGWMAVGVVQFPSPPWTGSR